MVVIENHNIHVPYCASETARVLPRAYDASHMSSSVTHSSSDVPLSQDAKVMGLVGLVHGTSHFAHLFLPPFFPFFMLEFGLTYTEVGLMMTLFFV
ncbi:hypothetical protein RZS08_17060, partial [Arthrospira platensis SPKY1]|nr:hypothetical protein [Arthrospira platensis SPKY1]